MGSAHRKREQICGVNIAAYHRVVQTKIRRLWHFSGPLSVNSVQFLQPVILPQIVVVLDTDSQHSLLARDLSDK